MSPDAAGVGQHRVRPVQKPELALFERFYIGDQRDAGFLPARPPAGYPPETTHSLKGSVATGYASTYPQACCTKARSSSVVPGVIRSTIEVEVDVGMDPTGQTLVQ